MIVDKHAINPVIASYAALIAGETDVVAILANTSAFIMQHMHDINWAGFYLHHSGQLVLGPFQGRIACTRIALGRGACGTAFVQQQMIVIDNVHQFSGHILCDHASNSEIVIPLQVHQKWIGVLDVDSPHLARFGWQEQALLVALTELLQHHLSRSLASTFNTRHLLANLYEN